jgi:hypothetical protein
MKKAIPAVVLSLSSRVATAAATVALPRWFGDNMVLQTNDEYGARSFLNGIASPGEMVTMQVVTEKGKVDAIPAQTDEQGEWKVQMNPAYSYGALNNTIHVTGNVSSNTVTANNVTFGDVFMCSGQSNMVYPLKLALHASDEADTLRDFANFRFFVTSRATADEPQWDLPTDGECDVGDACNRWITHEQAMQDNYRFLMDFSAVCFMTVRDIAKLHDSVGSQRPVGLIQTAWSGTRVEAWMSTESIRSTKFADNVPEAKGPNQASVLYNAMIHPWRSYAVRAVLWYQGESNADQYIEGIDQTEYYATMYQTMIADWRLRKGMGDFAWGTVQLPPSVKAGSDPNQHTGRMEIRIAQAETAPHRNGLTDISAVAVTLDLGGSGPWGIDHPPNKNEISRRLALGMLHCAYAEQTPLWTGPVLHGVQQVEDKVTLSFNYTGAAMTLRDVEGQNGDGSSNSCRKCCDQAPPFEILQSSSWQTMPRESLSFDHENVILDLSAARLRSGIPVTAVRYAWSDYVECLLENSEGLVASPFVYQISEQDTNAAIYLRSPARDWNRATRPDAAVGTHHSDGLTATIVTPPLGLNTWNFYHCNIDENTIKATADAMVENGMKSAGYRYINIDDCWQVQRNADGTIQEDPARFPSGMKAVADYVHSRGLFFGLYTARGSRTCQNRPGSYMHEELDAKTYCDWGLDYLKVDNCGGDNWKQTNTSWIKFHEEFESCRQRTGRPIVLSVEYCSTVDGCGEWIAETANLWRTTGDIQSTWSSVMSNIHQQEPMYKIAKPGHFNDPDMLQIGNVGLTMDEQYSHMSLWCITAAPLLVGTDLIHARNETLAILTNSEAIAVNQDPGWNDQVQGRIVSKDLQASEVWAKRLQDGSWSVVLLNLLDRKAIDVVIRWSDLGFEGDAIVRDIWRGKDLGTFSASYTASSLRPHTSAFLRILPQTMRDS